MKIYTEQSLHYFDAWGQGASTLAALTWDEVETLEEVLEELYPDGIGATQLNDILAYDSDWVYEVVGHDEEDEEDEEDNEDE